MTIGPVVDCDIHNVLRADEDLYPYLSEGWREFVTARRRGGPAARPLPLEGGDSLYGQNPQGFNRKDAYPPEGGPPGSSLPLMREQLLDPFDIECGILTGHEGMAVAGLTNPYYAAEVARALNDHMIDHWLAPEPRLKGSVFLAAQVPESAAKEIRRIADRPEIAQAVLSTNPHCYPFGHPIYEPIHRACAETGLPLAIHALGEGSAGAVTSQMACGFPSLYAEFHSSAAVGMMSHFTSFFFHGVFERFPDFRLILIESGVAWIPAFLRRLDSNLKGVRREVPWCRRSATECFVDQVLASTQPLDIASPGDALIQAVEAAGVEDCISYASDYPHWDADTLERTYQAIPAGWRTKVMRENAARVYRVPVGAAA